MELRDEYLRRKNSNRDNNIHSRDILIHSVNDLYRLKGLYQNSSGLLLGRANMYILK